MARLAVSTSLDKQSAVGVAFNRSTEVSGGNRIPIIETLRRSATLWGGDPARRDSGRLEHSRKVFRGPSRPCALVRSRDDPEAFEEFYRLYSERLLLFFRRRVSEPQVALDLTAETFSRALECRCQFRGSTAEEEQGWLFAIARAELSCLWRRGKAEGAAVARLGVQYDALAEPEIERIEAMVGSEQQRPRLADALTQLPADQRRAVELRVVGDLEYAEVAAAMEVTEQVARARVSRGLRALAGGVVDLAPIS